MKHTLILITALSTVLTPQAKMTAQEAEETARAYVREEYELEESEKKKDGWEFEFLSETAEVEVALSTEGELKEYSFELIEKVKEKEFRLRDEEVKKILLKEFPDAKKIRIRRKTKKNESCYKVKFTLNSFKGEAEISGATGILNEYELESGGRK